MKKIALLFMSVLLLLAGCSNEAADETGGCQDPLEPVEVVLEVDQDKNPFSIQAKVTHEGVPITKVNDVSFEIWEHGNKDYHFIEAAEQSGDGLYTLDWDVEKDGVYYVYYHVTACDMHVMNKEQVVVGDVNVEEISATPDIERDTLMNPDGGSHHNH